MLQDLTRVSLADREVDIVRQTVSFPDGTTNSLTTREAQLLAYLAARPQQDVSREELLNKVWDYRASYATRAVDVTMRRLRAKVEPDPQSPVHLISVHGVGYRFVPTPEQPFLLAPQGFGAGDPTDSKLGREALGPPAERSRFVGRSAELVSLGELTGSHRLVSVLGPGGVGKSRLVAKLAIESGERWPGGVWWCEVEAADGRAGVVAAVAATLGVVLTGAEDGLSAALGRALAGRGRCLLVLDAFERHVGHAADTVGTWIEQTTEATIIVTSRERLRLVGERVLDVAPLSMADGKALLLDRLAAAGVATEGLEDAAVERVVERLERLPLALELAAPRARLMSLDALYNRLVERFKVLAVTARGGRTLRAVLDSSWELLSVDEQRALMLVSTFVGGFTLEGAEAVLGEQDEDWALDRIEALRDKSLLRVLEDDDGGEHRLGLYDSVREYAAERLAESGLAASAEARHAAHVLAFCEVLAARIETHGGRDRLRQLAAEADNLIAVVRRRRDAHPTEAVRALLALEPVFATRGPAAVYGRLLDEVLEDEPARNAVDKELVARLYVARGQVQRVAGDTELGMNDLEDALALVAGTGSIALVRGLAQKALLLSDASKLGDAVSVAAQGLELARLHDHRAVEGALLGMLAAFATMQGKDVEAERRFVEAIGVDVEVGNELRGAIDLANFGLVLTELGRTDEAEERLLAALKLHRAWRNLRGTAMAHNSLTTLRARQDRMVEARAHAQEALKLYQATGYTRFAALSEQNCVLLEWVTASAEAALPGLRRVARAFSDLEDPASEAMAYTYLAAALGSTGAVDEATRALARAVEDLHALSNPRAEGLVRVAEGFLALGRARAAGGDQPVDRAAVDVALSEGLASSLFGVRFLADLLRQDAAR